MKKILIIVMAGLLALSCTDQGKKEISGELDLASKIEYGDKIVNKVVFEGENYKMLLFAIKKDQVLPPHSAPMDAPLVLLEGSAKITIGSTEHFVVKGDMITLPKNIDHGVYPETNIKFLLLK